MDRAPLGQHFSPPRQHAMDYKLNLFDVAGFEEEIGVKSTIHGGTQESLARFLDQYPEDPLLRRLLARAPERARKAHATSPAHPGTLREEVLELPKTSRLQAHFSQKTARDSVRPLQGLNVDLEGSGRPVCPLPGACASPARSPPQENQKRDWEQERDSSRKRAKP
uniref:Uncharacterized protein n=1 Tax=Sphaerodactylus townsendi TaxID=933632 RepID=A0ACB8FPE2_9SAUR